MINSSLISVILPVYNAEKYVSQAIESILNQSYVNFELLIIDDASSDNSWEVISSFKDERIRFFKNERNIGSLLSRNFLFEKVRGDFIAFQDADDVSTSERFEKQFSFFKDYPDFALVGSWVDYYDKKGKHLITSRKPVSPNEINSALKNSIPIVFPSSMARNGILEKVGGFRIYFADKGNYDYDWISRISENFPVGNIPEVLYKMTLLPNSNSKRISNPEKIIGDKLVQFFAKERLESGKDSLMVGDFERINEFIKESLIPYQKDESLIFRKKAEAFFSFKSYRLALKEAFRAILAKPFKIINYRTFFYIIRKSSLKVKH